MNTFGCLFNLLLLTLLVNGSAVTRGRGGKLVLCYFEGAAAVRPQEEVRFAPEDLDVAICTHLVYIRAVVGQGLEVVPRDGAVDLWDDGGKDLYNRTLKLKEIQPGLKIFIDVFDSNQELNRPLFFGNRSALARFARNAADFVQSHGFDGMSFRQQKNYEIPNVIASILHEEFIRRDIKLMTFLLPPKVEERFEMTEPISRNFDLIVVGSYWKLPTEQAQIFSSLPDLERTVSEHTAIGIPPEKLVVGIPAFCISMKLCDRAESGIGSPICGGGDEGLYERPKAIFHNSELMRKMANTSEDWIVVRDQASSVPYGHSKSLEWTSFEDPDSVKAKANFILEKNLAGAAIMNVDMEDFKGAYSKGWRTFPLARAAFDALNGEP